MFLANQDAAETSFAEKRSQSLRSFLFDIPGSGMNRPPGVNRLANLDDYDDQTYPEVSPADFFPRFAAIS